MPTPFDRRIKTEPMVLCRSGGRLRRRHSTNTRRRGGINGGKGKEREGPVAGLSIMRLATGLNPHACALTLRPIVHN